MTLKYLTREQIAELTDQELKLLRIKAIQLLMLLRGECPGSQNTENYKTWLGNADALAIMGVQLCAEYRRRGHRDTLLNEFHRRIRDFDAIYRENSNAPNTPNTITFEELFK